MRKRYGFTLMEILVVVTIIGILSTVVTVNFIGAKGKARYTEVVSDMMEIRVAAEGYKRDKGFYPCDVYPDIFPNNSSGSAGVCPSDPGRIQIGDGGLTPYLNDWPTPPVEGGKYDWDYWPNVIALADPTILGNLIVRISLLDSANNTINYFCLYSYNTPNGCALGGEIDKDIEELADKSVKAR